MKCLQVGLVFLSIELGGEVLETDLVETWRCGGMTLEKENLDAMGNFTPRFPTRIHTNGKF